MTEQLQASGPLRPGSTVDLAVEVGGRHREAGHDLAGVRACGCRRSAKFSGADHFLSRVSVSFAESNLVPNAGLLPAAVLAAPGPGRVVEQSNAELKSAGLSHLPSGKFMADAAWLALTVMAHNLGRAVRQLARPRTGRPSRRCAARPGPLAFSRCPSIR